MDIDSTRTRIAPSILRHMPGRVLSTLVVLALPLVGWAQQDEPPGWLQVRIIEVKRDRVADWEDRAREISAAVAEAGLPGITVYEVLRGDIPTYHVVEPVSDLGRFDDPPAPPLDPEEMASWQSRVADTEISHRVFIARLYPEYSIQPGPDAGPLAVLQTRRNAAGRLPDYEQWIADDLLPALREAGVPGHTLSRGYLGDSPRNWYHFVPVDSWEALETDPLLESLGAEEYGRLMGQGGSMIHSMENVLVRARPDLSSPTE